MKYFLVFFSNIIISKEINKNKTKGILLPDITIAAKYIKNNKDIPIFKISFLFVSKKIGINKKNKANRCKYEPAINSSQNGPDNFLCLISYPNMS